MSIIRGERPQTNYYILNRNISEDKRLGWSARGLLVYLLGKPDHWKVSVTALVNETAQANTKSGRDTVYKLLNELIEAGYIERIRVACNGKFGGVDYIVCEQPKDVILSDSTELCKSNKPLEDVAHTEEPYTDLSYTAETTQVINEFKGINELSNTPCNPPEGEPLLAEKNKKPKSEAVTFKTFLSQCKEQGIVAIPEDDPVFAYAEKAQIPQGYIALAWGEFKNAHMDSKIRKIDWRAHFRNAVRRNWYKLWWFKGEECILSSTGAQNLNVMQAEAA